MKAFAVAFMLVFVGELPLAEIRSTDAGEADAELTVSLGTVDIIMVIQSNASAI